MRTALTISAVSHTVLVLWGVLTFAARPHTPQSIESVSVDVISATEFSQLTAGSKNAPKVEAAKPLVDTIGDRKPVDDPTGKIGKKEVVDATEKPPPAPVAAPPAPTPKPPPPAEKKPPEPKRDLIAEAIKKDQAKKSEPKPEPKKAEAKAATPPPKKEQQQQPQFYPKRIAQALLDKREPQRLAATGDVVSPTVPLGTANGHAAQLSQNELDALRERLTRLWTPPAGAGKLDELAVTARFRLTKDGRIDGGALLTSPYGHSRSPLYMASRDAAQRALLRAQPFDMLRPENYEQWKDLEITFDPREMIRG